MNPITLAMLGGSAIGGIANILGADSERDAERAQLNAYLQSIGKQEGLAQQGFDTQKEMFQPYANLAPKYLQQLESGIASGEFSQPDMGQFDYQGDVNQFLDPSMKYQMDQGRQNLEQSAVAGGGLSSGATLRELMNQGQDYARQDYGNAYGRMQQDKQFNYQDWLNHFNNQSMQAQQKYEQLGSMFNTGMSGVNAISGAQNNLTNSMMGAEGQRGTVMGQKNSLNDRFNANVIGTVGNTLGQMAGTFAGGFGGGGSGASPAPTLPQPYQPQNMYMAQNLNPSLMPQVSQGNL